ncbi:MAG TPA: YidC/Oxa1 family membrane protein insertase [Candidatus Limiplasma sp.]|nr:YidC/Oxa1 family membrane protein insertase [Candidatus Limiplasma sp.]
MDAINVFLAGILSGIDSIVNNYGWSIVVFTILIKLVLFPLDLKSRKSMRRMTSLQPQIAKLQKKYATDKEKLNAKTAELYRKERINPLSGCLPLLISFPVLIAMFAAMRMVANTELAKQAIDLITTGTQTNEGWLWVKNLWMPDSPFSAIIVDQTSLKQIPADIWAKVFGALSADQVSLLSNLKITADTINGDVIFTALQNSAAYVTETALWGTMPQVNLIFAKLSVYAHNNGFFILPVLAAVTQYLMTLTQPQTPSTTVDGAANPTASTNKFMKWFFPIFSLYICSSYNAGFSIYWVMANLISWAQGLVLNKIFDEQDKKRLAVDTVGEESLR